MKFNVIFNYRLYQLTINNGDLTEHVAPLGFAFEYLLEFESKNCN